MLEELVITLGIIDAILFIFAVSGVVSDFIFLHWKWLNDWIDTLPMIQEDENTY